MTSVNAPTTFEHQEQIYTFESSQYLLRGLYPDELQTWSNFCATFFGHQENTAPECYREYIHDANFTTLNPSSLIRVAICLNSQEIVAWCRIFLRRISIPSVVIQRNDSHNKYTTTTVIDAGGIGQVCTAKRHRRRGISQALLLTAMDIMRERHLAISFVHASSPAGVSFYQSLGYTRTTSSKWSTVSLDYSKLVVQWETNTNNNHSTTGPTNNNEKYSVRPAIFPQDTAQLQQLHHIYSEQRLAGCIVRTEEYWNTYLSVELAGSLFVLAEMEHDDNIVAWLSIRPRKGNHSHSHSNRYQLSEFGMDIRNSNATVAPAVFFSQLLAHALQAYHRIPLRHQEQEIHNIDDSNNNKMIDSPTAFSTTVPQTGAIVVVAKCPIRGKSKTRLIPMLGEEGSVALAESMLSDVVCTLEGCPALTHVQKILLYAPGNQEGLTIMQGIFQKLKLPLKDTSQLEETTCAGKQGGGWSLLPMLQGDLIASDLGSKLEDALRQARQCMSTTSNGGGCGGGVVFLGMDAPELSLDDIVTGLLDATTTTSISASAMLCPASDGGYGMLCVPPAADPSRTFQNMYWSHSLTAVSQMKALTDQNIMVKIGKIMHDIDEPADVEALRRRLQHKDTEEDERHGVRKNLRFHYASRESKSYISSRHPSCQFTRKAMEHLCPPKISLSLPQFVAQDLRAHATNTDDKDAMGIIDWKSEQIELDKGWMYLDLKNEGRHLDLDAFNGSDPQMPPHFIWPSDSF